MGRTADDVQARSCFPLVGSVDAHPGCLGQGVKRPGDEGTYQPKPTANARIESAMRMLGLQLPKSGEGQGSPHGLREIELCTGITPNNQEHHNLNRKTDSIRQQHNTVDCPLSARENQCPRISGSLR